MCTVFQRMPWSQTIDAEARLKGLSPAVQRILSGAGIFARPGRVGLSVETALDGRVPFVLFALREGG